MFVAVAIARYSFVFFFISIFHRSVYCVLLFAFHSHCFDFIHIFFFFRYGSHATIQLNVVEIFQCWTLDTRRERSFVFVNTL